MGVFVVARMHVEIEAADHLALLDQLIGLDLGRPDLRRPGADLHLEQVLGEAEDAGAHLVEAEIGADNRGIDVERDRKSTRLNSSHLVISYDVFCMKKK